MAGVDWKVYRFGTITLTGSNLEPQYTVHPIVGEVQKIVLDYNNTNTGGSIWIGISGTVTEELLRINGFSADVVAYPRVYPVTSTNASLSGTSPFVVPRVVHAPLFVAGSGLISGNKIDNIWIYYT